MTTLREKAEQLLAASVREFERKGERFVVPYQDTRIIVHPIDWTRGRTILRLIAPVVTDLDASPELHRRLGEFNNTTIFGKFYHRDRTVFLEHNLLGESVDRNAFQAALASVAHNADHLDDVLLAEFGGRKWSDDA